MRKAEAELLKLQTELAKLKQELRHAQSVREEITRDVATTQKQLEGLSHNMTLYKQSELRYICACVSTSMS